MSPESSFANSVSDDLWQRIRGCWPHVDWSREAFVEYLTKRSPRFVIDFYLASAAAHYNDAAWNTLETQVSPVVIRTLDRLPKADFVSDELWAEARSHLFDEDLKSPALGTPPRHRARIGLYNGEIKLSNFIILVAARMAIARKRRFKHVKPAAGTSQSAAQETSSVSVERASLEPPPPEQAQKNQWKEQLASILSGTFQTMELKHQALLVLVYRDGLKQKSAGQLLGMDEFAASRTLKAVREMLRKAMEPFAEDALSEEFTAAWSEAWKNCLENVQVKTPSRV